MSTPGPDQVVACPYCAYRSRRGTYGSFSAVSMPWGDPIYSDLPRNAARLAFVSCAGCQRCYMERMATILDEGDWSEEGYSDAQRATFGDLEYPDAPDNDQFHAALERGDFDSDPDCVLLVRLLVWWGSHVSEYHDEAPLEPVRSPRDIANMQALLPLLGDAHVLWRVELLRLLGRFREARALLEVFAPTTDAERRVVEFQHVACKRGDRAVRKVHDPQLEFVLKRRAKYGANWWAMAAFQDDDEERRDAH